MKFADLDGVERAVIIGLTVLGACAASLAVLTILLWVHVCG